jgi:hypothetical protein
MHVAMARDPGLDREGRKPGDRREADLDDAVRHGPLARLDEEPRRPEIPHDGGMGLTIHDDLAGQAMLDPIRTTLLHAA